MARSGEAIENPVTGERITFLRTTWDTQGELLKWEQILKPGAPPLPDHIHPRQEERVRVLAGTARVRLNQTMRDLAAAEEVLIPPGTPHGLWNEGKEELRVMLELRPALKTERFIETVFGLAREGKVNKMGIPNPLQAAVILRDCPDTAYLPGIPIGLQKGGLAVLAMLGRLLGYKAR